MPARRKHSLLHGSAKDKIIVWHREHRSKKNRRTIDRSIKAYKYKKESLLIEELDQENQIDG